MMEGWREVEMRGSADSAYRLGVQEGRMIPLLFLPPFLTEVRRGRLWRNKSGEKKRRKNADVDGRLGWWGEKNEVRGEEKG